MSPKYMNLKKRRRPAVVAAGIVRALDTDFGASPATATQAWFDAAKADATGYELFITTLHSPAPTGVNPDAGTWIDRAYTAGFKVGTYARYVEDFDTGLDALTSTQRAKLSFHALDVEDIGHLVTREMVNAVAAYGVRPIIYTGFADFGGAPGGSWTDVMGADSSFGDVPLWHYDGEPTSQNWPTSLAQNADGMVAANFYGWNESPGALRIGHQFDRNFVLVLAGHANVTIDRNIFHREWLA